MTCPKNSASDADASGDVEEMVVVAGAPAESVGSAGSVEVLVEDDGEEAKPDEAKAFGGEGVDRSDSDPIPMPATQKAVLAVAAVLIVVGAVWVCMYWLG